MYGFDSTLNTMTKKSDIPGFRPYRASVARKQILSPHFMRIVFSSSEFHRLGTDGFDQRIKILFPFDDVHPSGPWGDPHLFDEDSIARGMWYQQWKSLDTTERNTIRTYTIRHANPAAGEMTVDFVLHDSSGPAGTFAATCSVGDDVIIIGPDAHSLHSDIGIDFHPGAARHLLLMGDETAIPAISAILERLSADRWEGDGTVITEVPDRRDFLTLTAPRNVRVFQLARGSASVPRGQAVANRLCSLCTPDRLDTSVADGSDGSTFDGESGEHSDVADLSADADVLWEVPSHVPDSGLYAWVAGEAGMVRFLRRLLITRLGLDRRRIAFMGYWREGRKEI
jgi:NADPH-dependent ferric siderophore reductase